MIDGTFTFRATNVFGCFPGVMILSELVKHKFPNSTTLHVDLCDFQIITAWSNAQCASAPTTTILLITANTYQGFNCLSYVIKLARKNIAKLSTHPNIFTQFCALRMRSKIKTHFRKHWIYIYIYIYIYEVHTISFQTFFVWAFRIVVDSWKFTMLLLYILWDDWPIFTKILIIKA